MIVPRRDADARDAAKGSPRRDSLRVVATPGIAQFQGIRTIDPKWSSTVDDHHVSTRLIARHGGKVSDNFSTCYPERDRNARVRALSRKQNGQATSEYPRAKQGVSEMYFPGVVG